MHIPPSGEGRDVTHTQVTARIHEVKGVDSPATVRAITREGGYSFVVPARIEKEAVGRTMEYQADGGNGSGDKATYFLAIEGLIRCRGAL